MSLLSDLLSKIKHPEPRKDVPPGLRNTISGLKTREASNKRRMIILAVLLAVTTGSAFFALYLIETHLKRVSGQQSAVSGKQSEVVNQRLETKGLPAQAGQQLNPPTPALEKVVEVEKFKIQNSKSKIRKDRQEKFKTTEPKRKKTTTASLSARQAGVPTAQAGISITSLPAQAGVKPDLTLEKTGPSKMPLASQKTLAINKEQTKADHSEKDLYLYMARTFESKGDYPNALSSYKKFLKIEPGNYKVMNNIASILINLNALEEAKAYIEMALNIKNDYIPGLINMGVVLAKSSEAENAENFFMRAVKIEPDNRQALLNIAVLHEKQGNHEKAREYYAKLQRLGDAQGSLGLERIKPGLPERVRLPERERPQSGSQSGRLED